ncbi:MAG: hypothetical protein JSS82_13265 [Bacteroidetes bacterium]|nr:hypothetical protein [Bacteroidota bacterium]
MQQKLNRIIFLVLGLIMGIGGTIFLSGSKLPNAAPVIALQSPTDQKNASVIVEAHFQGKVDSLMQTNSNLNKRVTNSKAELQKAKQDNKVLLELVDTLLAHSSQTTDTATKLAQCDSLSETVQELIITSYVKDSLYEDMATTLQAQVSNKDTVISTQHEQYNALKLSFDLSLSQQNVLAGNNLLLEKQVKKFKIKNKLLSAGIFILSGIAAYQLLHH